MTVVALGARYPGPVGHIGEHAFGGGLRGTQTTTRVFGPSRARYRAVYAIRSLRGRRAPAIPSCGHVAAGDQTANRAQRLAPPSAAASVAVACGQSLLVAALLVGEPLETEVAAQTVTLSVPARTSEGSGAQAVTVTATLSSQRASARALPQRTVRQIASRLEAKAARTPAQRKVSSQFVALAGRAADPESNEPSRAAHAADPMTRRGRSAATAADPADGRVLVDIQADIAPAVLARIRALGGTVVDTVPRHRTARARLPLAALEPLATLAAVEFIRPADEALTQEARWQGMTAIGESDAAVRSANGKVDTTEGDVAHRADAARRTHGVDGTGIGIGVLSDGVRTFAERQASGDLPARVTVLPGQEGGPLGLFSFGEGREGTAMLEIVHDLAPGAELFFATGGGGEARMAQNIEDLCAAGADVIVDDIGYLLAPVFQDGVIAQAISTAAADGCYHFSAAGNSGNLNDGTAGVWEGDFATGAALDLHGVSGSAAFHDFGGGVTANEVVKDSRFAFTLQWADPWGRSANDYDLFLIDADGEVLDSSTDTQNGRQDPIESIVLSSFGFDHTGARVVIVKNPGAADRYLRLEYTRGELAIATAGATSGHAASEDAVGVVAVDVRTAAGAGSVFDGTEEVETFSSDGPRRIFFEADGTPITPGDFSSTGGRVLQKPDLAAGDAVSTSTPGFSTFKGTSAAAPHAAALAALVLEGAGGPTGISLQTLRAALTGSALDIEAPGVDRDSGAGIVMAPAAVQALAVAVADRNRSPVAVLPAEQTLAPGGAVTLDMADFFTEPDADALRYVLLPGDTAVATAAVEGTDMTLNALAPGRTTVIMRAIDPDGLSAAASIVVTVQVGDQDYDADDDGFIEVATLAQLDAVRHDLDGAGAVDDRPEADWRSYYAAFTDGAWGMGCPNGCGGYELTADLDFDTDGSGAADAGDDYWNAGFGWAPVGTSDAWFEAPFAGNGHQLANLFIDRPAEDFVGLFGLLSGGSEILDVGLVNVDVTGRDSVGGLAGRVWEGSIERCRATGSVTGADDVGGLVGWADATLLHNHAAVRVFGIVGVGGLVGSQWAGTIGASYATGPVSGEDAVGGLAGNSFGLIRASYASGPVSGRGMRPTRVWWCFETGGVGGLVGNSCGEIEASYATGAVDGQTLVGGLVGSVGTTARVRSGYWDPGTSGMRVGVGSDDTDDNGLLDGVEWNMAGVAGLTTAALQAPTGYGGIYATWNLDLDGDGGPDDPWRFGTATQYPVLAADLNDDARATWQEFGYQARTRPTLTATTNAGQARVALSWSALDIGVRTPLPGVVYTLTRDDGAAVEILADRVAGRMHVDTGVTAGNRYTYQVVAEVDGGEAARSAPVVVVVAAAGNQVPVATEALADLTLRVGADQVLDVSAAFRDPDGDALTYTAAAGDVAVVAVTVSGSRLTLTPAAAGRTTVTVTATDTTGSNASATQRFTVIVEPDGAVDYDTDGDRLIEIENLTQLDAARHDLDGDGEPAVAGAAAYAAAFPNGVQWMGCGVDGCLGYELAANLDFDTNGSGAADAGDAWWNDGRGWTPLGGAGSRFVGTQLILENPFSAMFEGNGRIIANLFIDTREAFQGLFGAVLRPAAIRNVGLIDVDVTAGRAVGALAGASGSDSAPAGSVTGSYATGRVTGETHVGGLLGYNSGAVTTSHAMVRVAGGTISGGLVGANTGDITACYATGPVSGTEHVGGLAGINYLSGAIARSYSTGRVSGTERVGGLLGKSHDASVDAAYATGSVSGTREVGGLIGYSDSSVVTAAYAIGPVSGGHTVGGLIGLDNRSTVDATYWDAGTSGRPEGDGAQGTAALQAPTGYAGLYANWNVDLDGDGAVDDPWDFGSARQYPALAADVNGDRRSSWQEFGHQLRASPTLAATEGQGHVSLTWTAVASHWSPAPAIRYRLFRDDGVATQILVDGLDSLQYADADVTAGAGYKYQVAAVVAGGEAAWSTPATPAVPSGGGGGGGRPQPGSGGDGVGGGSDAGGRCGAGVGGRGRCIPGSGPGPVDLSGGIVGGRSSRGLGDGQRGNGRAVVGGHSSSDGDGDRHRGIEPVGDADLHCDGESRRRQRRPDRYPHAGAARRGTGTTWTATGRRRGMRRGMRRRSGWRPAGRCRAQSQRRVAGGMSWAPIWTSTLTGAAVRMRATLTGTEVPAGCRWGRRPHRSRPRWRATGGSSGTCSSIGATGWGLFGATAKSAVIRHVGVIAVDLTGADAAGGLVGLNAGLVTGSYVTGRLSGAEAVGGLVGANLGSSAAATRRRRGRGETRVGGLVGFNDGSLRAVYATGRVSGTGRVGGLVGYNRAALAAVYATGRVSGEAEAGGLVWGRRAAGRGGGRLLGHGHLGHPGRDGGPGPVDGVTAGAGGLRRSVCGVEGGRGRRRRCGWTRGTSARMRSIGAGARRGRRRAGELGGDGPSAAGRPAADGGAVDRSGAGGPDVDGGRRGRVDAGAYGHLHGLPRGGRPRWRRWRRGTGRAACRPPRGAGRRLPVPGGGRWSTAGKPCAAPWCRSRCRARTRGAVASGRAVDGRNGTGHGHDGACGAWKAASESGFLSVTAGTAGQGSGTVTYAVAANAGNPPDPAPC